MKYQPAEWAVHLAPLLGYIQGLVEIVQDYYPLVIEMWWQSDNNKVKGTWKGQHTTGISWWAGTNLRFHPDAALITKRDQLWGARAVNCCSTHHECRLVDFQNFLNDDYPQVHMCGTAIQWAGDYTLQQYSFTDLLKLFSIGQCSISSQLPKLETLYFYERHDLDCCNWISSMPLTPESTVCCPADPTLAEPDRMVQYDDDLLLVHKAAGILDELEVVSHVFKNVFHVTLMRDDE